MPEFVSTRRSIIRTAAWSVPAVTVAAATPAFARSTTPVPGPNLSTSTSGGTPTRSGNDVTIAPSTIRNSGDTTALGLVVRFQTSEVVTKFMLNFFGPMDPANLGIVVSGIPGTDFTMTVPPGTALGQVSINPGGEYTSPAGQILTFATTTPSTLNVTATASNGGTAFNAPAATV